MKKTIIAALLVLASLPAFSRDNSASAWEFRRQQCEYIGKVGFVYKNAANQGKPFKSPTPNLADTDPLYTLAVVVATEAYNSASDAEAVGRMAYAKCIDNIDRITREWQLGYKTDPKNFQ